MTQTNVPGIIEQIEKPSVCFSRLPLAVFSPRKGDLIGQVEKHQKMEKHEIEKDECCSIIAIRPINQLILLQLSTAIQM